MLIDSFDGGLNIRKDPSKITLNQSVVCTNISTSSTVLKSAKDVLMTSTDMNQYFYKFKGVWYSSANYRDYLQYRSTLYFTEPATHPKKVFNGTQTKLGIDAPIAEYAFDGNNNPIYDQAGNQYKGLVPVISSFDDAAVAVSYGATATGDVASGTLSYRFGIVQGGVCVRHIDSTYSLASNGAVSLTFQPAGGLTINVYRSYSSTYRLIGQVQLDGVKTIVDAINNIGGNQAFAETASTAYGVIQYTMTYYSETTDTESAPMEFSSELTVKLGDRIQVTRLPVPTDPQVTHRRIYRLGANLTQMSLVKELDPFTTTEFYDYTDDINATRILESYEYLPPPATIKYLVEAYGFLFAADGADLVFSMQGFPEYWPASNRINFDDDITGILPTASGIIVSTRLKSWLIVGGDVTEFARVILSEEQGCVSHKSFKLVRNQPVWASLDGICSLVGGTVQVMSKDALDKIYFDIVDACVYNEMYHLVLADGSVFVLDARFNIVFSDFSFAKDIVSLGVFDNILYCVSDESKLGTLFAGSDLYFTYKTGVLINENHSETVLYNNVYVRSNGDFTVKIIIDDVLVQTKAITGNQVHDIPVPQEKQRGTGIQFELAGTGTIYALEYKPVGRQNGR